jgi:tRNA(Ile)-lysidine synthase TilS/MesJ
VRRIEEIKRQKCVETDMRTTYEKYTRQVRFSTYKTIASDALVVMGHNKDDCLENILQNIGNCHKYENLSGMDTLVVQDGISFFRPLLDISKEDIVEYAEMHQIPFLPNSTPAHFHRGKIRNRVVPVLDSWNNLFIPGLFHAKDTMTQMHNVVEMSVAMVVDKFENNTGSLDVSYLKMGEYFWKLCLKKLFPAEKMSNKMFCSLMELFARAPQGTRFEINKNLRLHMTIGNTTATLRFYNSNM